MSLYFLLGTLTASGQQMVRSNPDLLVEATRDSGVTGAKILGQYAVLGRYDFVMMADADDHDAVARLSLEIGVHTGLHIETLPAIAVGFLSERDVDVPSSPPTAVELSPEGPDHSSQGN
jgi:uncharacterized protein with GYD domain